MKKTLLIFTVVLYSIQANAQFLNAFGITIGGSASKQNFYFYTPDETKVKKNFIYGFNGSVLAELFSHDYVRWVSEFQYNQKGSKDKQPNENFKNKLSYISWNNYLKIRVELFSFIPYVLVGPRLEYKLTQKTTSPPIISSFAPLHVSAAFGVGAELVSYGNIKFFAEAYYNPDYKKYDVMMGYVTKPLLNVQNVNYELRVGLKYQFKERSSCNVPTYVD